LGNSRKDVLTAKYHRSSSSKLTIFLTGEAGQQSWYTRLYSWRCGSLDNWRKICV